MTDQFDYVVVGAGSAGSVLAARLSDDPSTSVCVLEAGPADRNPFIHIPAGFMKTFTNPSVNWMYQTEPTDATGGRPILTPRGKTLGGSSSINGHIYNRGMPDDFNTWAQLGNRGWGYNDVLPYFKRSERLLNHGDSEYHGRDGELLVANDGWPHPLNEAFIRGAESIGIPRNNDYNGATQDGVGYTQHTINRQRRVSSYRAFLHSRRGRANVEIRTGALAERVVFDGKRATGVRYLRGGKVEQINARREVILCGGAINSPQLMQLSGVGPAGLLNDLGIDVVHELAGVGENLRDHFGVRMSARVKGIDTINELSRGIPLAREIAKFFLGKRSILGLAPTLVYAFWRSNPDIANSDVQISFTPASYNEGVQNQLDIYPGMSIAGWPQRPESRGHVRAVSSSPHDKPIIQPNYLDAEIDRTTLFGAIRLGHRILNSEPMAPYYDRDNTRQINVDDDDELMDLARERGTTMFHVMGTCRMGPESDPQAVVDDQLRVRGVEGLRIADASIMPTMPSANTNASSIMIGEKAADMIAGKEPLPAEIPSGQVYRSA